MFILGRLNLLLLVQFRLIIFPSFMRIFALNCLLIALSFPVTAAEVESTYVYLSNGQLEYVGPLDETANQRLFDLYEKLSTKPTVLSIRSPGGEVNLGMSLGSWVRAHRLNVKVMEFCLSSCANYVFPAGIQKIVSNFAVIGYHGGPSDPKNLKFDSKTQGIYDSLSASEQKAFMDDINKVSIHNGHREAVYLQKIGVRSDITSLGQDDKYEKLRNAHPEMAFWTYSLEDFNLLGVNNISIINPPWKPGTPSNRKLIITIPVENLSIIKK